MLNPNVSQGDEIAQAEEVFTTKRGANSVLMYAPLSAARAVPVGISTRKGKINSLRLFEFID